MWLPWIFVGADGPSVHPNEILFFQCLKFKTNQAQDVQKVEKLNSFFVRLMSCKTVDASTAAAITAAIEQEGDFSPANSRALDLLILIAVF